VKYAFPEQSYQTCLTLSSIAKFKETLINKIKEFIDDCKLNENQKARLRFILTKLDDKVLLELKDWIKKCGKMETFLPSTLGMKVGKYNLLPTKPKTKNEYIQMIKYTLKKAEMSRCNQKTFWALESIEYGFNFVKEHEETKIITYLSSIVKFKETLINKIKEFIDDCKLNENQKARLRFILWHIQDQEIQVRDD
jgi:hypothetical protein